ncbi:MAG: hypothetical protein AB8B64_24265 [Granulosicoccus sp.]
MSASKSALHFYQFLGAHSFLIGLLPFFLPVYLWTHGLGLAGLSLLIGSSGLAFAASLRLWQRLSMHWPLRRLIALTFLFEVCLVFVVGLFTTIPGMALFQTPPEPYTSATGKLVIAACCIGLFNGLYNAFFWTTQRTLFLQQLGQNDTGKQYGNFQIFVTLFLKTGIILGGFLLENGSLVWILALSAGISAASNLWLARPEHTRSQLHSVTTIVNTRQSLAFSDSRGSRKTFAIDGLFLYLESHFWTLSLFLVVREDFSKLGIAVVLLALGFALMFFVIKNRIDHLSTERLFHGAVLLYALSWLLRFTLNEDSAGGSLIVTLLVITFFSSFFRLAFNKRFFDVARSEGSIHYLLVKSYTSQLLLGILYTALGTVLFIIPTHTVLTLQVVYLVAAVLSLVYLGYRDSKPEPTCHGK